VVRSPQELTRAWLGELLGATVESFEARSIGTGQMSESTRVSIAYAEGSGAGPASVILKTASADAASRATGVSLGAYEREVRFYRELAGRLGGPLAHCRLALIDGDGSFTIVLEDLAPAEPGDQLAGCEIERARLAMRGLAELHAPVFGDPELGATPWLNQPNPLTQALLAQLLPGFLERYQGRVAPEHEEVCRRFVASLDGWSADRVRPPLGLVHGDYRLDNMLFGAPASARRFTVVDWQTVGWGPAMTDAAYFLGSALEPGERRANERELLREYHAGLLAAGVRGFDWERCWLEYRRQVFLGILMTVAPAMIVERTARGDEMFLTILARCAQQIIDLDALELLPAPGSGRAPALRPQAGEEARHEPGAEQLWNESWYFDAVSEDERSGVYVRLGLYPNLGVSWITAFVCGPGRETVALLDFEAPLPRGAELVVSGARLDIELLCERALELFRVRLRGTGEAHADAAALLRGERGEPVEVALELAWETHGSPYAYRVTTRYEIPCRVHGTITIGEESLALSGSGQRDHSWGTRDWWSADWMWSAGELEDGTRLHGVEFRLPDAPPVGIGYLQDAAGEVLELDSVRASEQVAPDGLISAARIAFGELRVEVLPLAFGPLRLQAPDGRVTHFPRAMCALRSEDGRSGVGWVEWNRNVSGPPGA
jgi:hypothetical protein